MKSTIVGILAATGLMVAGGALATDMPLLAKKNACVACHAINKKVAGPAWMDVSVKYKGATRYTYKGKEYPLEEGLIMKVSKGGSGVWGAMPEPVNAPAVKDADIRELVRFILRLANPGGAAATVASPAADEGAAAREAASEEAAAREDAAREAAAKPAVVATPAAVAAVKPGSGSTGAFPADMRALAAKSKCLACHAMDKQIVGPSWTDIAKKYKGDAGAEARLVAAVSGGSSGNWGNVRMPPSAPAVKEADIKVLVKFILSLGK